MNDFERYLREHVAAIKQLRGSVPNAAYVCLEDFVLKFGHPYEASQKPAKYQWGEQKQCYSNSVKLAAVEGLIYVEGYGLTKVGVPILHGWCIDPDTNKVIDITSPNITDYFGIPFEIDFVLDHLFESKVGCMIDNWQENYPLLQMDAKELRTHIWAPS